MPISKYDHLFGGPGSAAKALQSMKRTYGAKKGQEVFYGTVHRRERKARIVGSRRPKRAKKR